MTPAPPPPDPRKVDVPAAFLSYLLPGLGQVMQGRVGKGVLFFVCLYTLFFYGMWLGKMKNVYLPNPTNLPDAELFGSKLGGVGKAVYHRPVFLGQFWMGVAAWPAVLQYAAGGEANVDDQGRPKGLPVLGTYMRAAPEDELNTLQRDGNKRWDLGWVYTLVAGVLNLLVIFDALAGPIVLPEDKAPPPAPTPEGGAA